MKSMRLIAVAALLLATINSGAQMEGFSEPLYKVTVEAGTTKAINYEHLGGTTKIHLRGTVLLPKSEGVAGVENQPGAVSIEAHFSHLELPSKFDPIYLTYVLWAISPEGRAVNLGELLLDDGSSDLTATTELQTFGLIVTAEPYFGVTQPSNVVVLENVVPEKSKIKSEPVEAKYEFLQRGPYTTQSPPADLKPVPMDKEVPFDLYQARNAVKIARAAGADTYAADAFGKAVQSLQEAEDYQAHRHWYSTKKREVIQASRRAVQAAEDARLLTMKRKDQEQVNQQISSAQQQVTQAEADKAAADQARQQADLLRQKAESEKALLRTQLRDQLNLIFATRDTARGLIMSMPNALFATDKYDLTPPVREKLAKIAGVVMGHPGLKLMIEGHTDSVGSDDYNQQLSEKRAGAVKDYLAQAGVPADALSAQGFGKAVPIASNDTVEGRQQNRRVEIVVSGNLIGTQM